MKHNIYLAGPVTGESYKDCTEWRSWVINLFGHDFNGYSPLRTFDHLLQETTLEDTYDHELLSTQRGIFARCTHDVQSCDAMIANLLGAKRISIGTIMEISWAWQKRVPIILVMENEGNLHEHSMIREACPFRVETVEDAVDLLRRIMLT